MKKAKYKMNDIVYRLHSDGMITKNYICGVIENGYLLKHFIYNIFPYTNPAIIFDENELFHSPQEILQKIQQQVSKY